MCTRARCGCRLLVPSVAGKAGRSRDSTVVVAAAARLAELIPADSCDGQDLVSVYWRPEKAPSRPGADSTSTSQQRGAAPVWERLARSARAPPADLAGPAQLCFDAECGRMYWLCLRDAGAHVGSRVRLRAEPAPARLCARGGPAVPELQLELGPGAVLGPFGFAPSVQGGEGPVEVVATLADTGAPLAAARLFFFPREPPGPPPLSETSPASSGSPRAVTPPTPISGAKKKREAEETAGGEEVLARAARDAQKDGRETIAFFDPSLISVLEALTLGGSDSDANEHPPQRRPRPSSDAPIARAEPSALAWLPEWGAAPGESPAEFDDGGSSLESDFLFASARERGEYEILVGAALRNLEEGELPGAPAAFLHALASGPALDSRFVRTPAGQRDLRRALPLLRAATRSMAAERVAVGQLVRSAVCGMLYFSRNSPAGLPAACERSYRLVDALVPNTAGVTHDLALLPLPQAVQLAALAVDLLEPNSEEDPGSYAEALSQLGHRLLQNIQDEEACKRFTEVCALAARRRLTPCRAECRALRGLAVSHARRFLTERAAEYASKMYWFEDSRDPTDLRLKIGCLDTMKRIAGAQRDWQKEVRMLAALDKINERQLSRDDPDLENYQFICTAYFALDSLYRGRYLDFVAFYGRAVRHVRERPGMLVSPFLDVCGSLRATRLEPRAFVAGLRLACRMQRIMDWRSSTPLLAHLVYTRAMEQEKCGDFEGATASYLEARKEYERFPAVFPSDHPRMVAIQSALDAIASCTPPPDKGGREGLGGGRFSFF